MPIDLTSKRMLSDRLNAQIDKALQAENALETPRDYLGGSQIGADCERALQYDFFNTPKDEGREFSGQILRIFERGYWVEDAVIPWLRLAGVEIHTEDENGNQFGFSEYGGKFAGHYDGIITAGPAEFGPFPRLWENKGLKQEAWRPLVKNKLKKEKPIYYAQCQIYMEGAKLTENPALFSAVNMNTMEIYWESVPYSQPDTERLYAKAVRILQASHHGELLPRMSQDPTFYKCKWCDWNKRCFAK
ncbi:MAG: hypothetical protein GY841_00655 [FCB group bacterium]|nr:hypothetical protein [FCB group bacterium]